MGLENYIPDTVMNDIIGFTPCNFCDYTCITVKFVAHLPALVQFLLQKNDASLAGIILVHDGLSFEGATPRRPTGRLSRGTTLQRSVATRSGVRLMREPGALCSTAGVRARCPSDQSPPSSQ